MQFTNEHDKARKNDFRIVVIVTVMAIIGASLAWAFNFSEITERLFNVLNGPLPV